MFANLRKRGTRPTLAIAPDGNLSARMVKRPTLAQRIADAVLWPVNRDASEAVGALMTISLLTVRAVILGVVVAGVVGGVK